jgi:transcriptional activator of cad operon
MPSDPITAAPFRLLDWRVYPARGLLTPLQGGEALRLDARTFQLLLQLARRPGEVVSIDELLDEVWAGVIVSPDSVYQAIAGLRRALGDDAKEARYIATVPRQGYRLVATPQPDAAEPVALPLRWSRRWAVGTGLGLVAAAGLALLWPARPAPGAHAVAVLPFSDLTDAMDQEPFADGMTEQIIDTLSRRPGWQVPALSRVMFYKGKEVRMAQLARDLGVAHLLEGSVRRSGDTLRVSARLISAANGYVVWSESFDRPGADRLAVQAEVAAAVGLALDRVLKG